MLNFGWGNLNDLVLASSPKRISFFESSTFSVEDLLDEDNIIDDIRFHFNTASNYFNSNPILVISMLECVFENQTKNQCDEKKNIKFPYNASEIFACELPGIMDHFFNENVIDFQSPDQSKNLGENPPICIYLENNGNESLDYEENKRNDEKQMEKINKLENYNTKKTIGNFLMEKLFSIFKKDELPDDVTMLYFKKILYSLMNQKGYETINYIFHNEEILSDLFKNISTNQIIAEIIYKILIVDCCYSYMNSSLFMENRRSLIFQIYDKIQRASFVEQELENYVYILTELLKNYLKGNNGKELVISLLDDHNLEIIYELLDTKNEENLKNISNLLYSILAFKLNETNTINYSVVNDLEKDEILKNKYLILLMEKKMGFLMEIIFKTQENNKILAKCPSGTIVPKIFGLGRSKLLECLHLFLKWQHEICSKTFLFYNFFEKLLCLFGQYPKNNILHNLLYSILETSISINSTSLNYSLFEEAKLIEFLMENLTSYDPKCKINKCERTYFGHLMNLANLLNYDKFNADQDINKYLRKNGDWQEFISSKVNKVNEVYDYELGGCNPKKLKKTNNFSNFNQKEEMDDFDLLFVDHCNNKKINERNEFELNHENEQNFNNNLVNSEDSPDLFMKYEPEEDSIFDKEYNYLGGKISSFTFSE